MTAVGDLLETHVRHLENTSQSVHCYVPSIFWTALCWNIVTLPT